MWRKFVSFYVFQLRLKYVEELTYIIDVFLFMFIKTFI